MIDFTEDQIEFIYKATRYYQINKTIAGSSQYQQCDDVLNKTFPVVNTRRQRRNAKCDF